jgi:hypothetical protein
VVIPVAAPEVVGAAFAVKEVPAGAAENVVVAFAAPDVVGGAAAIDPVVAVAADEVVFPGGGLNPIVAGAGLDVLAEPRIGNVAQVDDVVAMRAVALRLSGHETLLSIGLECETGLPARWTKP